MIPIPILRNNSRLFNRTKHQAAASQTSFITLDPFHLVPILAFRQKACAWLQKSQVRSAEGRLILCLFSRGDEDIKRLWPDLKHAHGDDVLKDAANTMFQTALSKGMIGLPIPHHERTREEMIGWVEEKVWASKLLTLFGLQALKVPAETDEQGKLKLTKNNARKFFSTDKDDFHDAGRNAYIAFRIWLLDCDAGWSVNDRDAALCRSR